MLTSEEKKTLQQLEDERDTLANKKRNLEDSIMEEERKLMQVVAENMEIDMRIIVLDEIEKINMLRYDLWRRRLEK